MRNRDLPEKGFYKPKNDYGCEETFHGMTKRESAAIAAMQGLCASSPHLEANQIALLAEASVSIADALFDELEKKGDAR